MFKILGPPARNFAIFQPGAICESLSSKNRKLGLQKHYSLSTNACIVCSVSSHKFKYKSISSKNFNHKQTIFLPQTRNNSSIQSFAATQAGIFKTLSESTPVEYCQKYLLYVHELSGLPWWASIIISTILVRSAVTFPVAIYQQSIVAKLENLKLELPELANELKRETAIAVRRFNWDEKTARMTYNRSIRKQWNQLIVRDNCHPFKTTILLWIQLPLWVSLSISLRNLVYMLPVTDINAQLTYTELVVGGFSFIPNLTIPDGSWIFPVGLGLLNLAIIEIQILSRNSTMEMGKVQKYLTNAFRVISLVMVPIAASVPSCLVLYWTTSSACGLAQNLFLLSPRVRRLCRIPETDVEVKQPYTMIINKLKSKLKMV